MIDKTLIARSTSVIAAAFVGVDAVDDGQDADHAATRRCPDRLA